MKQILILINCLSGGGAERMVLTLARKMVDMGHSVHMVLLSKKIDYNIDFNLPIHCFEVSKKNNIFNRSLHNREEGSRFKKFIVNLEKSVGTFDFYLSNLTKSNKILSAANLPNSFFCIHNEISQKLRTKKGLFLYLAKLKCKAIYDNRNIIAVSNGVSKDITKNIGVKPKNIQTIYNPIDFENINKESAVNIKIPFENYIINVASFREQKRHDILLKAFAKSKLDCKLVLLGRGDNEEKIKNYIVDLNIEDKVILAGFQVNPYPWLKKAKLFVLSSDHEGFGLVIAESLVCGTPVVSTNCPSGPEEILTGDLSKGLVPVGDITKLAKKMREYYYSDILSEVPARVSQLDKFNVEHITRQYLDLVNSTTFG